MSQLFRAPARARRTTHAPGRARSLVVGMTLVAALGGVVVPALGGSVLPVGPADAATTAAGTTANPTTAAGMRAATSAQLFGAGPYRSATSVPAQAADRLATTDPAGAAAARTIAQYPIATWLGEWSRGAQLTKTIDAATAGAAATGTTAVFVTYAIPDRDCGGYSSGGFDEAGYDAWIDTIVASLAGKRAAVIVEPDAVAMLSDSRCGAGTEVQRSRILSREVRALTAAGVPAYLDAGNSNWVKPAVMAERLRAAGVDQARGFATNVSNYYPEARERSYADAVSAALGGAHYVIDTSRNGQGWRGTWCNGPGAGLGTSPRVVAGGSALDALLWVKTPGASDGPCDGGPAAGQWWSAYAQALVANARLGESPTAHAPVHALDVVHTAPAGITATGWAVDPDAPTTALRVTVTVDGVARTTTTADRSRVDASGVAGAGDRHGWTATVASGVGEHTVCALVGNVGAGADGAACRTVSVPAAAPTGRVDAITGSTGSITMRGWAFDRDDVRVGLRVAVSVDGRSGPVYTARDARDDVAAEWSVDARHGFERSLRSTAGKHRVCLTALGIGAGGDRAFGCRTVAVR